MPKYLVCLTANEPSVLGDHPNCSTICSVVADDRRKAVQFAAKQYVSRYLYPIDDHPQCIAEYDKAGEAIVEGFDVALRDDPKAWQPMKDNEWFPLRFTDTDDSSVIEGYVVRVTTDIIEGINVTA